MRLLAVAAFVVLLSLAHAQTVVATISTSAKFSDLVPRADSTYQYLYYVTDNTLTPTKYRWDCRTGPYPNNVCSSNCGQSNANGPQCSFNPPKPSGAPYGYELSTWPWQVRWGVPVSVSEGGSGIRSGFGFRGTVNNQLDNIYETFWVGEAVHFNNPIWVPSANQPGGASDSWTLVITLFVTDANGIETNQDFAYRLRLDETRNDCDKNDGCPWTSSWWSAPANNGKDTRDDCPVCPGCASKLPSGLKCCRYYTLTDLECADRVWTLDALDQSKKIRVNGMDYTLNIKGFSIPENPNVQKDYFISQEQGKTKAEIYANLVTACPDTCPSGSVIVDPTGTECRCVCDPTITCPTGQVKNATCSCNCPANALNCNSGTVVTVGNTCQCQCPATACPGSQVRNTTDCSCKCPAGICGPGSLVNPNDPACPCACPPCGPGQVTNNRCAACACPAGAEQACTQIGGNFDTTFCNCTLCSCPPDECKTDHTCPPASSVCQFTPNTNATCGPVADKCLSRCGSDGTCVYAAVDCSTLIDLVAEHGAAAAVCYDVACEPTTGDCFETFNAGRACTPDVTPNPVDTPCLRSVCRLVSGAGQCVVEPNPNQEGLACPLVSDDNCNGGQCASGSCQNQMKIDQPCTDGSGCTYLEFYEDPITRTRSDACRPDPTQTNIAKCTSNKTICDGIVIPCVNVTCLDTPAGAYCVNTPLPYNTSCDDGSDCTVNDICSRELRVDPETGEITWGANGICEGVSATCISTNPCEVGRCLEGVEGGCTFRTDVRNDFVCGVSENNCTIFRCDNGTCVEAESICPGVGSRTGAIVGATVAGVAAIAAAAAIAAYARNRIADSKVFDPTTWDQLQAGAGTNSPLYEPKTNEQLNQLYHNDS